MIAHYLFAPKPLALPTLSCHLSKTSPSCSSRVLLNIQIDKKANTLYVNFMINFYVLSLTI